MQSDHHGQVGFTLVEIAIVLVIVGLLLGGLLKGQQMIAGARLQSIIEQHNSVQAAYQAFLERYRQPPGDMNNPNAQQLIGPAVNNGVQFGGDGNGRIDEGNYQEASAVWHHLAAAGYIKGGFAGGASAEDSYRPSEIAPINPFNGRVLLADLDDYLDASPRPPVRLAYVFGGRVPVDIMHELDMKLDDGRPATGSVRATSPTSIGAADFGATVRSDPACVTGTGATAIWATGSGANNCNAIYLY